MNLIVVISLERVACKIHAKFHLWQFASVFLCSCIYDKWGTVFQDLAFKIDLLEELFESVIKSLSLKTACEAYVSLAKIYRKVTEMIEPGVWCTEVKIIANIHANMGLKYEQLRQR